MMTRREAVRLLSSASAGAWFAAAQIGLNFSIAPSACAAKDDPAPPLAPGAPASPERVALIDAFKKKSEGLQEKFEARTHKSDWVMPYRLFRPEASGKVPLVVYLHGSGGLGDDNLKQLAFGNIFGTRVWLLPENQKRFPCYVVAPADRSGMDPIRFFATAGARAPRLRGRGAIGAGDRRCVAPRVRYRRAPHLRGRELDGRRGSVEYASRIVQIFLPPQ